MQLVHIGGEHVVRDLVDDVALFHHVMLVGHGRGEAEVLLHQDDGEAALLSSRILGRSARR